MAQVESTAGMVDVERAARGEWLSWTRMSDFSESAPPVIVGGDGPYVIDQDGRRLLDCVSGLFTTQIGYSHGARIGAAAATQLERLGFYPNWAATHPAALALTERILGLAPAGLTRALPHLGRLRVGRVGAGSSRASTTSPGASTLRRKVIARRGAYHGCSLGRALADRHPGRPRAVRAAAGRRAPRRRTPTAATARSAGTPATRASMRRDAVEQRDPRRGARHRRRS